MTKDILLCGVGGQDTALTSRLIALAAMEEGMETGGAETIGMTQRGESVVSHVHISEEAYSPLIPRGGADVLIGLEPTEAVRCLPCLKKGGCMVVSPAPIRPVIAFPTGGDYAGLGMMEYLEHAADNLAVVNATSIGMVCGSSKATNVALLGAAITNELIGIPLEEVEAAIEKRVPEKFKGMNMKTLKLGASTGPIIR